MTALHHQESATYTEVVSLRELLALLTPLGARMVRDPEEIVLEGSKVHVSETIAKVAINKGLVVVVHRGLKAIRYAIAPKGREELEAMNFGASAIEYVTGIAV